MLQMGGVRGKKLQLPVLNFSLSNTVTPKSRLYIIEPSHLGLLQLAPLEAAKNRGVCTYDATEKAGEKWRQQSQLKEYRRGTLPFFIILFGFENIRQCSIKVMRRSCSWILRSKRTPSYESEYPNWLTRKSVRE